MKDVCEQQQAINEMYLAGRHPLYPYTEEERLVVLQNAGVSETQLKNDVHAIKDWFQKQPHLAHIDINDNMVALYIIMAKGSVEKAKQRIDCYFRDRTKIPEFAKRVDVLNNKDKPIWPFFVACAPKLYNGSRVSFGKVFDWDKYTMTDIVVDLGIICDIRYYNDLFSGETYVVDLENATLSHILTLDYLSLSRAFWFIRNALGLKIFAIHIINCSAQNTMQSFLNFLKLFMSKKIMGRVIFHKTLEDLHKYVPKEYLPQDYGGYLPSCKKHREKYDAFFTEEKTKEFLLDTLKLVSDETKRPKFEYTEDALPGNFRKLDFD